MRLFTRAAVLSALALVLSPAPAAAQLPEGPYVSPDGRLTVAGELSAAISPRDNQAFFNYTDYDHDALRAVRARVLGQWRASGTVSVLGELRIENADSVEAAALFVRWRPSARHDFTIQAGRVPPVIGAFARRAYGRDNITIGIPLAYQYLTSLRPDALPATADDLLRMRARGWRPSFPIGSNAVAPGLALVSAFHWDTGAEAHWHSGRWDLSGAVTRGAPAVPAALDAPAGPAVSGRIAVALAPGLTAGASAARGRWIHRDVLDAIAEPLRDQSRQTIVGADVEAGVGRWLVRGEWLRSSFQMPAVSTPTLASPLSATSAFVEGRYRWHPRWQAAARVERLTFSSIRGTALGGVSTPWDAPVTRLETVVGYRVARNLELRAAWQQNWRDAGRVKTLGVPVFQTLYWF